MFLTLSSIFNYLLASPSCRCIVEGEAILAANHLVLCGVKGKTVDRKWNILAYCLQTSAVKSSPHEINGTFSITSADKVEIDRLSCSCKAGVSGSCKHVAATLLFCSRKPLEDLEELSSTDTECLWKVQKTKVTNKYLPQPLHKTRCFEKKRSRRSFSREEINKMFQTAAMALPKSSFALHRQGRQENNIVKSVTIPPYITQIYRHSEDSSFLKDLDLKFSLSDCCRRVLQSFQNENVLESMCCEQGTLQWKGKRRNKITGSTCYAVFTFKKQDWSNLLQRFFNPVSIVTKEMRHGSEQESFAIKAFEKMNPNLEIKKIGILICQKFPWLAYSPDGIIFEDGRPSKLLEIKCPYLGKIRSEMEIIPTLKYLNIDCTLKQNHSYYAQIQFGMDLLNLDKCEFVIYFSKEKSYLQISVPFNRIFAKELIETVSKKYFGHMIHYVCG